MACVIKSRWPM